MSESVPPAAEAAPAPGGLPFEEIAGDSYSPLVLLRDEFGNLAVLRCLDAELTADPGFQQAYPAEAAALAGLAEPRVAAAHRYVASASGAVVAVIRRRLAGTPLSELLAGLPRGLDSQTAALVVRDVLIGLDALHARGAAHRSVRPDRIVVEPDGTCVLVDAGLAPRAVDEDPAAAVAADLAAIPDLYAACAGAQLEGMRGVLHTALVAARRGDRTDDQLTDSQVSASALRAALDAAISDSFDSGWEALARAQLAALAEPHREPRLRVVDLLPARRIALLSGARRGSHAGARRDNRDLIDASKAVFWQASEQLLRLWLNGRARRRRRNSRRAGHASAAWSRPGFGRYAAPLIAFLIAFGLVVLVLSSARSSSPQAMLLPSQTSTSGVAQAAVPSTSASASTAPSAAITKVAGATHSPSAATSTLTVATVVRGLTVTGFSYDKHGNQAHATVQIRTSGAADVSVTVVFEEPDGWVSFTGDSKTHRFTLSGKTEYTLSVALRLPRYCSLFGSVAVAAVKATASVPPSHAVQASDSSELWANNC